MTERSDGTALLVAVETPRQDDAERELLLDELVLLLGNLGIETADRVVQKRDHPDPAYYCGSGKAEEIREMGRELGVTYLVSDDRLTPGQVYALQQSTGLQVMDRAEVIMRIFESRAHTAEAKLQVELARCRYEIPHLKGLGLQMSRAGGGIGTRGPGETEFERHRRKLERRSRDITKKLAEMRKRRQGQRKRREKAGLPTVALTGYTNSGKSTLLRSLSGDRKIAAADKLFATVDTCVRRVELPSGEPALFADTVGFIRKLPPDLVAAFKATLEEVENADQILLLVDSRREELPGTLDVVQSTLHEIGAGSIPRIVVLNKIDRVSEAYLQRQEERLRAQGETVASVCARSGAGTDHLLRLVDRRRAMIR
ncbi:MAG: GTPase HflX [Synergistales bacterium]|nr:GTPase HflX [Synergistales bacterium]